MGLGGKSVVCLRGKRERNRPFVGKIIFPFCEKNIWQHRKSNREHMARLSNNNHFINKRNALFAGGPDGERRGGTVMGVRGKSNPSRGRVNRIYRGAGDETQGRHPKKGTTRF